MSNIVLVTAAAVVIVRSLMLLLVVVAAVYSRHAKRRVAAMEVLRLLRPTDKPRRRIHSDSKRSVE